MKSNKKTKIYFLAIIFLLVKSTISIADDEHHDDSHHSHEADHHHEEITQTEISIESQTLSSIKTAKVKSEVILSMLEINGKVFASEHKIAHIVPRFSGVVLEGKKHLGDSVKKGELLAVIESNQSLRPYEVHSQIDGTIVAGHLIVGEFVSENQWVFIVADTSEVWIDFYVSKEDVNKLAVGNQTILFSEDKTTLATGKIFYISPFADEKTQTQVARAVVANPEQKLKPGMFLKGKIEFENHQAKLAVKNSAIQEVDNQKVIFEKNNNTFIQRRIKKGLEGEDFTEVLEGINEGAEYVTDESYLIKADILKSEASHEH